MSDIETHHFVDRVCTLCGRDELAARMFGPRLCPARQETTKHEAEGRSLMKYKRICRHCGHQIVERPRPVEGPYLGGWTDNLAGTDHLGSGQVCTVAYHHESKDT